MSGLSEIHARIRQSIATLPRLDIALKKTPLEEARNLSRVLGGPRIFVKRDDLTGVALGGNKLRNLEFRLAHAMKDEPDTVIVGLDLQSNSARQTVGACNKLGLRTILVLEGRRPDTIQGNLLVDYLLGAEVHFAADVTQQRAMLDRLAADVRAGGGRPHILNDNPMFDIASAVAYLEVTLEIVEQLDELGRAPACLYMSSSGKGQAGMILAQKLLDLRFAMHGVTATDEFHIPSRTATIANETSAAIGLGVTVDEKDVVNFDDFVGEGYGIPSEAGNEAVRLFARTEGIILDPIYTGKAAAGLVAHVREGRFANDDVVVFVHTGGTPAIFTWNELWL
ncbi:pyridoxal-phosphate dependent enzyme [Nitratireductor sp. CAU 1489]|uniref:Pyridoxal-phosphate dependent enzyme n=1 Tax=Nitratireductor arenosus TaxID=2682096 RepID=A0A844QDY0_9HYPH|nr:pyridoxal-phosphate dependent enzyme [Nitratireductor arenosus]MVA96201.1 pyridoxal-phosphate dependent enzyme [Nitratireductor arenosus]